MTLSGELCSHRVAACHRQQVVAPPKLTWIALFHCLRVIPFLSCFMVLVQECDGGPCSRMWRWFLLNNVTVVLAQECDIGSCSRMWRWFLLKNVTVVLAQECDGGSCSRMWQSFYCMGKQAEVPGIPLTPHLKNWTAGQTNRVYPQIVQRMVTAYSGLARTIYIRCIHGIFGREMTKYTVIYGAYVRFWPTLHMCVSDHNVCKDALCDMCCLMCVEAVTNWASCMEGNDTFNHRQGWAMRESM